MNKDYTSLLKEIHQTIASFSEGAISFDEALHKYLLFKEKANRLQSKPNYENYIRNILATHNAENFSIFSAIIAYNKKDNKIFTLIFHGPHTFMQKITSICNSTFFSCPPRYIFDYTVKQNIIKNFSMHSSLLFHNEELSISFVAISSSAFFTKEAFLRFASHIKVAISPLGIQDIMSLDIPNIILKYIHQVCSKLLTKGPCSLYGIYLVNPLATLNHFGLHALKEFSALTKKILIENFGQYSFALSINLYLCINTNTQQNIKSLTFNYKDILIPSKMFHKVIEKEEDIIPTIIQILHFH